MSRKVVEDKPVEPASAKSAPVPDTPEQRISLLEQQVRSLLLLHTGIVFGDRVIPRCACNRFATREVRISHPGLASLDQLLCGTCKPRHPLIGSKKVELVERPIFGDEKAADFAAETNAGLSVIGGSR